MAEFIIDIKIHRAWQNIPNNKQNQPNKQQPTSTNQNQQTSKIMKQKLANSWKWRSAYLVSIIRINILLN